MFALGFYVLSNPTGDPAFSYSLDTTGAKGHHGLIGEPPFFLPGLVLNCWGIPQLKVRYSRYFILFLN